MLNFEYIGPSDDLFEDAFYDSEDGEFDLTIQSVSATQIVGTNPVTGWTTTFTGTGFSDPEVSLTGTLTAIEIRDDMGTLIASFSGMSWGFAAAVAALTQAVETESAAQFIALLNLQPVNINAANGLDGLSFDVENLTSVITAVGTPQNDEIFGGSQNDSLSGGAGNDQLVGNGGNDTLLGEAGSDTLLGGAGNDSLNPGDNNFGYDLIRPGTGNDTVDLSGAQNGYFEINHADLTAGVTITIDTVANTGTINKGANGTTTVVGTAEAVAADGLGLFGSQFADTFNVTVAQGGWMSLNGYDGADTYVINAGAGRVRLDFSVNGSNAPTAGLNINLVTGAISNDGYGNVETISGAGQVWEVRGTAQADVMQGANANESFIGNGGNDTVDGGDGFDRLRFDSGNIITGLNVDMAAGTATGIANGDAFTVNFSNIEHIRGSENNDMISGSAGDDRLEGRRGDDTLLGGDGSDTIRGGDGDDSINTGDNDDFDQVRAGSGNDTVNLTDAVEGFFSVEHGDLGAGISVTMDLAANTATIDKGVNGTTSVLGVNNAMLANGLLFFGSTANDTFNVTAADGGFLAINGYRGADTYIVNASMGFVRLDFLVNGDAPTSGAVVNLETGVIANDGYGYAETISGSGRVNEVRGTRLADVLVGSAENESFIGNGGNDTINGGGGIDRLRFDSGATISGLSVDMTTGVATGSVQGRDDPAVTTPFTLSFSDIEFVRGSEANDTITGSRGADIIEGKGGADLLRGNVGNDSILAGAGNDTAFGGVGFDTIRGGTGNDRIDGGSGADSLLGDAGNDRILGGAGFDIIRGGDGNDSLIAGDQPDRVFGGDGDDLIRGGVNVGGTVDGLFGEAGDDRIFGDGGFDLLDGGAGNDYLDGGNQADNLYGAAGDDWLVGGAGFDRLFGGTGNDSLFGGLIFDTLLGQQGNDMMVGGRGDDRLLGGSGNDTLLGDGDNDELSGNAGFDLLIGGAGDDLLRGDFNGDTFRFADRHGNDTIEDFDANNSFERLDFRNLSTLNSLADVLTASTQTGANTVIDTGSGNSILLLGVNRADLDISDFFFG